MGLWEVARTDLLRRGVLVAALLFLRFATAADSSLSDYAANYRHCIEIQSRRGEITAAEPPAFRRRNSHQNQYEKFV